MVRRRGWPPPALATQFPGTNANEDGGPESEGRIKVSLTALKYKPFSFFFGLV